VVGGAETVVSALLDALGPDGTLMAYTGWQDAPPDDLGDLDEETKQTYIEEHPAYDPRVALSCRDHGRIPEALRTWPGARHSWHPEAGVAVVGLLADELTAEHPYDDAYGVGTPYARLVELGGQVVVLGAPLNTVTLIITQKPSQRSPTNAACTTTRPCSWAASASGGPSRTLTPLRAPCLTNTSSARRTI
jgi:aminoglycoside 3-N-acetyltransferase